MKIVLVFFGQNVRENHRADFPRGCLILKGALSRYAECAYFFLGDQPFSEYDPSNFSVFGPLDQSDWLDGYHGNRFAKHRIATAIS